MSLKKIIIIGYCIIMVIASLYVPCTLEGVFIGFYFTFTMFIPSIDYGRLVLEVIAITAVAYILYLFADIYEKHKPK
jgi:hypothetical protein